MERHALSENCYAMFLLLFHPCSEMTWTKSKKEWALPLPWNLGDQSPATPPSLSTSCTDLCRIFACVKFQRMITIHKHVEIDKVSSGDCGRQALDFIPFYVEINEKFTRPIGIHGLDQLSCFNHAPFPDIKATSRCNFDTMCCFTCIFLPSFHPLDVASLRFLVWLFWPTVLALFLFTIF